MICLIALPVLAILGIFSATHRKLFYESVDCVFRKVTLRKCESRLDERLKSKLSGRLFNSSPKIASFVYNKFELLSWIFVILMILSLVFSVKGVYNYVAYGNCNGLNSNETCVLDEAGNLVKCTLNESNFCENNNCSVGEG